MTKRRTATIWPLMGIHAQDTKHAGAWRLHVLASTLDHNEHCDHANNICKGGSGKIDRATLEAEALALGVKRSTFYTWLADARKWRILNGEGEYLYLASQEQLSNILLCNSIDKRRVVISLKLLFKPGWKSIVWAAYLKANHHKKTGYTKKLKPIHKGKIISGKTLEDLTGIQPRQQRRYKKFVSTKKNISITTIPGDWETANALNQSAKEHGEHRHYFVYNDPRQKDPAGIKNYRRVIASTLPARRTVSDKYAQIGARGRRRKILKGLRLVSVSNYPILQERPQQAVAKATNREAQSYPRRYILFEPMLFREWTSEQAQEVYILRAGWRKVGVFDREFA